MPLICEFKMNKYRKIAFQRIVDSHFGKPFYMPFLLIRRIDKRKFPDKIKHIAIFRLSSLGDSILLLPAIKNLKEKTGARITIICANENLPVFEGQEFVDKIILLDNKILNPFKALKAIIKVRREKPDMVIDTTHSSNLSSFFSYFIGVYNIGFSNPTTKIKNKMYDKSTPLNLKRHMSLNYLDLFKLTGAEFEENKIKLVKPVFSKKEELKMGELILDKKKLVGIHAISSPPHKKWDEEKFANLIKFLLSKGYNPVFTGSISERMFAEEIINNLDQKSQEKIINLCGKTSTKELFALMGKLKFFIAIEGGPMHISASMNIPTLGIFSKAPEDPVAGLFGSYDQFRYYPYNGRSEAIYKDNINDLKFLEVKKMLSKLLKIK